MCRFLGKALFSLGSARRAVPSPLAHVSAEDHRHCALNRALGTDRLWKELACCSPINPCRAGICSRAAGKLLPAPSGISPLARGGFNLRRDVLSQGQCLLSVLTALGFSLSWYSCCFWFETPSLAIRRGEEMLPDVHPARCALPSASGVCLCKASLCLVKAPAKEQHLLLIPSLFFHEASSRGRTC